MTNKAREYRKQLRKCINELNEHELYALLEVLKVMDEGKKVEPVFAKDNLTYGSLLVVNSSGELMKKVMDFMFGQELYLHMLPKASFTGANLVRLLAMLYEKQASDYKLRAVQFEPKPYRE